MSKSSFTALKISLALLCCFCTKALAIEAQLHGQISQGYIKSWGNNYFGDSSDTDGTFEYRESALYGQAKVSNAITFSGQVLARDAGTTDNDDIRIDYLFADWRAVDTSAYSVGTRVGRIRNELGLYNQTRDIVFARPSILLPQSVYLESTGLRELLFSSDAIQFYGEVRHANSSTSGSITFGRDTEHSKEVLQNLLGSKAYDSKIETKSPFVANIKHDFGGSRWLLGLSYAQTDLHVKASSTAFTPEIDVSAKAAVLSAQANLSKSRITAEVFALDVDVTTLGSTFNMPSEGGYLQIEQRLTSAWELVVRQEIYYPDRRFRNRLQNRDFMVGIRWEPTPSWLLALEFHHVDGNAIFPRIDNLDKIPLEEQSNIFALMGAYRF